MAADQIKEFLENGNIKNSVNFPSLYLERTAGCRLAVTNTNVPKMLGSVLSVLADANINVADMLNKSRGDLAYNLIDMESCPDEATLAQLRSLEGIVNVRLIGPPK
jgi:D-3-phosphoglycerate dehydrogenase